MRKELIICIVIIIFIFGLNFVTQKNTDNTVETISNQLKEVRSEILQENQDKELIAKSVNKIYDKWEELDDIMAYYIEHDEIEKVKTALTSIKSYVEVEEYSQSIEAIDKCIYILDHIHEREMFTLDNIF